jgi:signal transduction histidine kinase
MTSPPDDPLPAVADRVIMALCARHGLAYVRISPDLRVVAASAHFIELLSDPLVPVEEYLLDELIPEFIGAEGELTKVQQREIPEYRLEKVNRTKPDGTSRYYDFTIFPFDETDLEPGLIVLIEDSTEKSLLEQRLVQDRNELRLVKAQLDRANVELERLNRLKSLFLSIAAHNLRAPLSAISCYAGLVREALPTDSRSDQREFLAIIEEQVDLLDRQIGDLTDLDQIEQGTLRIKPVICNLSPIIREVSSRLAVVAEHQNLTLLQNLPPQPIWVLVDPQRVRQILYNLIDNAIKYTPEAGQIEVSAREVPGFGAVQIKDSGPGIPEADRDQLFQLYYRTGTARQSKASGAGIGLYIVKYLVDAQRGKIEVDSQAGQGTTFSIYFPLAGAA